MTGTPTTGPARVDLIRNAIQNSFGPVILPDGQGVQFRLWAPSAHQVDLILHESGGFRTVSMQAVADGWFLATEPSAGHGTLYQFRINNELNVPDPGSRFQPKDVHGPSQVVDTKRFQWRDARWKGRLWEETVLYELHVGTFTPEGTFQGVKNKLDYLADLGVTAIELMPLADFPGNRNWGYDGVLPYAPESAYGTPDDLKDLIDTAHQKGLMVFLDVVYNHFGPDGNYLHTYAQPFFTDKYHTPWGAAIDFEGQQPVRDFFIQNAIYWLRDYHFDGLRFDAVHAIYDESPRHFLNELAETVRAVMAEVDSERQIHLVLENDDNASRFLAPGKPVYPASLHFNAQWNDDFHHATYVIATGDASGYYEDYAQTTSEKSAIAHLGRCLAEGFAYQGDFSAYRNLQRGEPSRGLPLTAFVNFLQNHDQVGNRAFGERRSRLTKPEVMCALLEIFLLSPSIPLLFMGEEWQAETPFLFFCDFHDELATLVRDGRRREFARFPEFSDPEKRERIPDPSVVETFEASKLNWDELKQDEHVEWLQRYRRLLALRRERIVPALAEMAGQDASTRQCNVFEESGLVVQWPFPGGKKLILAANLGPRALTLPDWLANNKDSILGEVLYRSPQWDAAMALGKGTPRQMPPWSVSWIIG